MGFLDVRLRNTKMAKMTHTTLSRDWAGQTSFLLFLLNISWLLSKPPADPVCLEPTTLSTTTLAKNTTETFFTQNNYQNSIILIVSFIVLILYVVTVITIDIVIRKQKNWANKVRKQATTDENPVYGIYDDGSCYNVVTDDNTHYASQIIINCLLFHFLWAHF